ncbi:hypothetical protein APS56_05790 [Pseudalgibacter alginicilyticus]|uniref:DUF2069 domain-containing protein n=1 Tax=Pseudalgibacter alginicilyticus TaxID=1736674 RepID=A0A0P0CJV9_9FLAO|nr:hypothetical protein [Pseudalgibacter alginicilyticus]ALJ04674.1 hypothetical protein APS56_05790 [Pseudalgibacter alginicilyticus]
MKVINSNTKFIPYLYFLSIVAYWFTVVNRSEGITAYPILLFGIPFLWQLIKPNKKLNFILGISFVCLSSYMILAWLSNFFNIISFSNIGKQVVIFAIVSFIMALWMIRNSLKENI